MQFPNEYSTQVLIQRYNWYMDKSEKAAERGLDVLSERCIGMAIRCEKELNSRGVRV